MTPSLLYLSVQFCHQDSYFERPHDRYSVVYSILHSGENQTTKDRILNSIFIVVSY